MPYRGFVHFDLSKACHPGCRWFGRNARGTAMWLAAISFKKSWATGMAKASFVFCDNCDHFRVILEQSVDPQKDILRCSAYFALTTRIGTRMGPNGTSVFWNVSIKGTHDVLRFSIWCEKKGKSGQHVSRDQTKNCADSYHHKLIIDVMNPASRLFEWTVNVLLYLKKQDTDFILMLTLQLLDNASLPHKCLWHF